MILGEIFFFFFFLVLFLANLFCFCQCLTDIRKICVLLYRLLNWIYMYIYMCVYMSCGLVVGSLNVTFLYSCTFCVLIFFITLKFLLIRIFNAVFMLFSWWLLLLPIIFIRKHLFFILYRVEKFNNTIE